jgi:inner membrane protein
VDNVTHALAGLVLAESVVAIRRARGGAPSEAFRRAAAAVGVICAELPDADLLYAGDATGVGRLGYLLHHRGHTHTVVVAILLALAVWGVTLALRRPLRAAGDRGWLLAVCLAGTLLTHLTLDWTNSYGVHPFWPLDDRWYYGDAVFIVEPWLWIASIPPLLLLARATATRVLAGLLLVLILGAAWSVDMVQRPVAVLLSLGAVAWTGVAILAAERRRAALAAGAWIAIEATFLVSSWAARGQVRAVVGPTYVDAALTPIVGDATCYSALVVERDGATYRVSSAMVAPWPALRGAERCPSAGDRGLGPPARPSTAAVSWGGEWSAPQGELATLARNCVVAAALRFVRVPVWSHPGGEIDLWDARFGRGGFAGVMTADAPSECPRHVPPWTPPRMDMLR